MILPLGSSHVSFATFNHGASTKNSELNNFHGFIMHNLEKRTVVLNEVKDPVKSLPDSSTSTTDSLNYKNF